MGKDKFFKKLDRLPDAVLKAARYELETQAMHITTKIKQNTPVSPSGTFKEYGAPGALKASVGYTFGQVNLGNSNVRGVSHKKGRKSKGVSVKLYAGSPEAYYAAFVEFGTVDTLAQPFFYPVFRRAKRGANKAIKTITTKALLKEFKR